MRKYLDECGYLIHLVRCAIHNLQPRELPDGLSFEQVYDWGLYHHIANIAFYSVERLKNKPEVALYRKWQTCRDQAIVREITQGYAAMELREALQGAGIRVLEVQGTRIKPLYPQPDWRTMSDIDFIIDPENLPKAARILEGLGYECQEIGQTDVNAHRPPNINIELHSEFFSETSEYRKVLYEPFASVDENGQCEPNAFYLYNILHIAKHYFCAGCGIRRVLDVYYLNKCYGHIINQAHIQNALERVNASEFAAELGRLADVWFGEEELPFLKSRMATYIINAGLHGNWLNERQSRLEEKFDNTVRFPKLRYYLCRFFGTGGILRKRYPVLERHPILYPFCWFCRAFSALRPNSIKRIRREVNLVADIAETEE